MLSMGVTAIREEGNTLLGHLEKINEAVTGGKTEVRKPEGHYNSTSVTSPSVRGQNGSDNFMTRDRFPREKWEGGRPREGRRCLERSVSGARKVVPERL